MRRPLAALAALVVLTAACGGAVTTTTAPTPGFPREIAGITLTEPPQRIISGSATHTEILFAIGAGDQVVAVDAYSDHPAAAANRRRVDALYPNVEGFAELEPDLVVVTFDPGDLVAGLGALGIPVLVLDAPPDLEGVYRQFEQLGDITGHRPEAEELVNEIRAEIADLVGGLPQPIRAMSYYHELDPTFYSVGSDTFLGSLYGLVGLTSIADAAGGGYPQLSAEFIIHADPDFVFLGDGDCCGQTPEVVGQRPGWNELSAVAAGRVVVVDEALASRWGPRLVEFLSVIVAAVYGEGS